MVGSAPLDVTVGRLVLLVVTPSGGRVVGMAGGPRPPGRQTPAVWGCAMPRRNVWMSDELVAMVAEQLPGVNLSAALRAGLLDLIECDHHRVLCADCGEPVDLAELVVGPAIARFFGDGVRAVLDLMHAGGTCEGAAQVLKAVAIDHQVPGAHRYPLERPSKARRRQLQRRATDLPSPESVTPPAAGAGEGNPSPTIERKAA